MSQPELRVIPSAACRHLRSKGMYVTGTLNPAVDDGTMGDGYCWCNQTQHMQGPDDQFVTRDGCNNERRCYEAVL